MLRFVTLSARRDAGVRMMQGLAEQIHVLLSMGARRFVFVCEGTRGAGYPLKGIVTALVRYV